MSHTAAVRVLVQPSPAYAFGVRFADEVVYWVDDEKRRRHGRSGALACEP
jgi:hypothetical protein